MVSNTSRGGRRVIWNLTASPNYGAMHAGRRQRHRADFGNYPVRAAEARGRMELLGSRRAVVDREQVKRTRRAVDADEMRYVRRYTNG